MTSLSDELEFSREEYKALNEDKDATERQVIDKNNKIEQLLLEVINVMHFLVMLVVLLRN